MNVWNIGRLEKRRKEKETNVVRVSVGIAFKKIYNWGWGLEHKIFSLEKLGDVN